MENELEHYFQCPYCWTTVSMLLDMSLQNQVYVEDCERCCQPIEIRFTTEAGSLSSFDAERAQ